MATRRRKRKATQVGTKRNFEKKHFNYGRWTKGRFSEAVTVTGPAKMVFLAGIGSEHEQTGKIMYPGDFDGAMPLRLSEIEESLGTKRRRHV